MLLRFVLMLGLIWSSFLAGAQPALQVWGDDQSQHGQRLVWQGGAYYLLCQLEAEVGGQTALLMKLSPAGELLWSRAVGTEGRDLVADLEPHREGVLVLGRMVEPGNPNLIDDVFLHYVNSEGTIEWSRYFGTTSGGDDEHAVAVVSSPSAGITLFMREAVKSSRPAYVVRLDSDGTVLWGTQLQHEAYPFVAPQDATQEGTGFWLTGSVAPSTLSSVNEDGFVARLNNNATPQSWAVIEHSEVPLSFREAVNLPQGCLLVGNIGQAETDLLLAWVDETGAVHRIRRYRDPGGALLLASDGSHIRPNGQIVIAANYFEAGGGVEGYGIWLLLEPDGTLSEARRIGQGQEVIRSLQPVMPGRMAGTGSSNRDALFFETPYYWEEVPENCQFQAWRLESVPSDVTVRTFSATNQPWLRQTQHEMMNLPYGLGRKPDLCCPERDTVSIAICEGEAYAGFSTEGVHQYTLDTVAPCGWQRTLFLAVNDTLIIDNPEVEPTACGEASGRLRLPPLGEEVAYSLNGQVFQSEPIFNQLPAGPYAVWARNESGCLSRSGPVVVPADCGLYLPSAFSPNGDGRNDELRLYTKPGFGIEVLSFQVYGRYGGLLYEASGSLSALGWDGRAGGQPLNPGVYTCVVAYRTPSGQVERLATAVHLLR